MNVNFIYLSHFNLNFLKENFLTSLLDQQKKILALAAIAFGSLAAYYVVSRYCFKKIEKKVCPDGKIEKGEFKNGVLHGKGKRTLFYEEKPLGNFNVVILKGNENKSNFHKKLEKGEFKEGDLIKGKKRFPLGEKQVGEFKDGRINGNGKVKFPDGEIRIGIFKDGRLNGQGKIIYSNGVIQEGIFSDCKFEGKKIYKNGMVKEVNEPFYL